MPGRTRRLVSQVRGWTCCARAAHHGVLSVLSPAQSVLSPARFPWRPNRPPGMADSCQYVSPPPQRRVGSCKCAAGAAAARSSQATQTNRCVWVKMSVPAYIKASTTDQTTWLCQCIKQSCFLRLNQQPAFKSGKKKITTSKRAASGPFHGSSPSQLKIPLHCRLCFENAAECKGALNMVAG